MERQKEVTIYPWSMSATGYWDEKTGLNHLRDYANGSLQVNILAGWLLETDGFVMTSAVVELIKHGNFRQAAVLTRELIGTAPDAIIDFNGTFGEVTNILLKDPLEDMVSRPEEYPKEVKVVRVH